ncbi:nucleophosmin-like [Ambystoma mexicanum]|uniref:nucleophosmin-like n=1 Tax=Ambystoma mexicanum TaxID=8296 RepID=UPI0037E79E6A
MARAPRRRTHSFLFGCTLTGAKREVAFPGGGEDLEEQLSLRTVSLGLGAPDEMHVLEAQGEGQKGPAVRIPVATVLPRLQCTVLAGDLDLLPPVTFCLVSGSGPLHISAEHLVASGGCGAAKRAAPGPFAKARRKRVGSLGKNSAVQATPKKKAPGGATVQAPQAGKSVSHAAVQTSSISEPPPQAAPPGLKPFSVEQMQNRLLSRACRGGHTPRTVGRFQKFARVYLRTEDPRIVQELWHFMQSDTFKDTVADRQLGRGFVKVNYRPPAETWAD